MKNSKNNGIINNWWLSISIKRKILYFVGTVVVAVIFVTVFSIVMLDLYLKDFNTILGDSYLVNDALVCFEKESAVFRTGAFHLTEELIPDHDVAQQKAKLAIGNMKYDIEAMNAERYMLTQAINIAYCTYTQKKEDAIHSMQKNGSYEEYYEALKIEGYISQYFQELMQETLNEGTNVYDQKVKLFRILPLAAAAMSSVIIVFALKISSMTIRDIVHPVIKIADSAYEISKGNFNIPDVQVQNKDEIGRLAKTFNIMKASMASSLIALKEKNRMSRLLHQEEIKRIAMEQELKEMQLSMLQSQINPHFLFNTLNTIRNTAYIENAQNTQELIEKLGSLFRYNLSSVKERVTLLREINIIEDYIFIQRRRFGHRLNYVLDSNVNLEYFTLPTFTLQPLVENAIIHGIAPREEGGSVRIRIRESKNELVIFITDTGKGISKERLKALLSPEAYHKGHLSHIGIGNVKTRIELIYPDSTFKVFSKLDFGTSVRLTLKLPYSNGECIDA